MSLWKYKYFLDVVELKSFTKAGARNYVTQTAVSQQIASLEKMAGGTLLERGNGEICLTELGEIVYEHAREMVLIHERMLNEIERYKESSVLRIGIDSSINKLFWAKMQKMINDKHSEKDFRFHPGEVFFRFPLPMVRELQDRKIHRQQMGFLPEVLLPSSVVYRLLSDSRMP